MIASYDDACDALRGLDGAAFLAAQRQGDLGINHIDVSGQTLVQIKSIVDDHGGLVVRVTRSLPRLDPVP